MFTVDELKDAIETKPTSYYGDQRVYWELTYGEKTIDTPFGTAEFVEDFGGEGQGDTIWIVFKIGDRYFKKFGSHISHDGSYWDGHLIEVRPVQRTVTFYE